MGLEVGLLCPAVGTDENTWRFCVCQGLGEKGGSEERWKVLEVMVVRVAQSVNGLHTTELYFTTMVKMVMHAFCVFYHNDKAY